MGAVRSRPKAHMTEVASDARTTAPEVCWRVLGQLKPISSAESSYHVTLSAAVYLLKISSLIVSMARAKPFIPSPTKVTSVAPCSGPPAGVRV